MNTLCFVLIVAFGVFVQAAAGFGGPLISMPIGVLLKGIGISKPVMTFTAFLAGISVLISDYKYINWKELAKMVGVMLIGLVFGLWIFKNIELTYLLLIYAIIVLIIGIKKLFFPGKGRSSKFLCNTALAIAGVMQGLFVSGGSFLAVYAVEKIPEKREFRATVNAVWAVLNIVLMITYWQGGMITKEVLATGGICVVPCCLAIWSAGLMAKKIEQKTFLKIIYIILIASGIVLLVSNL